MAVVEPIRGDRRSVKRGFARTDPYNHYSMLRTIEESWHLSLLGMATDTINVKASTTCSGEQARERPCDCTKAF